ncbi:MAG: RHS repeat-associated core domain-containing protein, partial [Thermoguttaceae bacterium]|nr:RHS repeat-associated core domain-containing protein [Thermoguttaceae bacterium]
AVDGGTADLVAWTLTDHLNMVRDIARFDPQTGATTVVNHLVYDAFGRVTSESNPAVDSLFLFTARPFDEDTQLQNNLNRWYDASVGRWLSEDPMASDVNLHRYCGNDPVMRIDPTGLIPPGWDSPKPGIPLPGHGFPPERPGDPWWGGGGRVVRPPYKPTGAGAAACNGYNKYIGSTCKRCGETVTDPYPAKAKAVCNKFMELYEESRAAICVANCLTGIEAMYAQMSECSERNKYRLNAHVFCYATCAFVPYRGLPEGAAEVGWGMLLGDWVWGAGWLPGGGGGTGWPP